MLIDQADTRAEVRGDNPAEREVIDDVGHERVAVALASDRHPETAKVQAAQLVRGEVELFFKPQRSPFVAGASPEVIALVVFLSDRNRIEDIALGIVQVGPAALDSEVESSRPTGEG